MSTKWVYNPRVLLCAALCAAAVFAGAQQPPPANDPPAAVAPLPAPLAPPPAALEQLSAEASTRTSFTLDRSMLDAAANIMGGDMDQPTRQAINHLDSVSVHLLRFADVSAADPELIAQLRRAYHVHGWKHVVNTGRGGAVHDGSTDVWVAMRGANLRCAVVLVQTPRELTLATVAGNLSPIDLLHLRGHFGIPRFDGDRLEGRY